MSSLSLSAVACRRPFARLAPALSSPRCVTLLSSRLDRRPDGRRLGFQEDLLEAAARPEQHDDQVTEDAVESQADAGCCRFAAFFRSALMPRINLSRNGSHLELRTGTGLAISVTPENDTLSISCSSRRSSLVARRLLHRSRCCSCCTPDPRHKIPTPSPLLLIASVNSLDYPTCFPAPGSASLVSLVLRRKAAPDSAGVEASRLEEKAPPRDEAERAKI